MTVVQEDLTEDIPGKTDTAYNHLYKTSFYTTISTSEVIQKERKKENR